jgi:hypothetical protein
MLQALLQRLGFTETAVPGSHVIFTYPEPNTLLVYRKYQSDEILDGADVAKTRRYLDGWGLVEENAFDRLLQETAA